MAQPAVATALPTWGAPSRISNSVKSAAPPRAEDKKLNESCLGLSLPNCRATASVAKLRDGRRSARSTIKPGKRVEQLGVKLKPRLAPCRASVLVTHRQ